MLSEKEMKALFDIEAGLREEDPLLAKKFKSVKPKKRADNSTAFTKTVVPNPPMKENVWQSFLVEMEERWKERWEKR